MASRGPQGLSLKNRSAFVEFLSWTKYHNYFRRKTSRSRSLLNGYEIMGSVQTTCPSNTGSNYDLAEGVIVVGKQTRKQIRSGRSDFLVRARDGRNLLIIEVKEPGEPLDENTKEQGLSYARLLRKGGIAPFVILTNGTETQVVDSITGEIVSGQTIPLNHPSVLNGFRVGVEDIALRSRALQTLISISTENLLAFCMASVDYHIALLRSHDLFSGKKYIPQLYVERENELAEFHRKLEDKKHPVLLVTGKPQVGKTNFLCRQAEAALASGKPCLFYPAIAMEGGLLDELRDDFEWTLGDSNSTVQVARKLEAVLGASREFIVFVDGLNEAEAQIATSISENCRRLKGLNVSFVISFTNTSADRLLCDHRNNPNFIAEASGVAASAVPLIEISPENIQASANVIVIGKYSPAEMNSAYSLYKHEYHVEVHDHHIQTNDPFLLGLAMRLFEHKQLPNTLDEPELIRQGLEQKAKRAGRLDAGAVYAMLTALGRALLVKDRAVTCEEAQEIWRLPLSQSIPVELYEAALISRTKTQSGHTALTFYYERERDFVISHWVREWPKCLSSGEAQSEIASAAATRFGTDALRWFLTQPPYLNLLIRAADGFVRFSEPRARQLILCCINRVVSAGIEGDWIPKCMQAGLRDEENRVKIEAVKLLCLVSDQFEYEELAQHISGDPELISGLLNIDEEYPLVTGSVGELVLQALRSVHWHQAPEGGQSEITDVLRGLIRPTSSSSLISSAATALGFVAPEELLSCVCSSCCINPKQGTFWNWQEDSIEKDVFLGGIRTAGDALREYYYGSMCPGYINVLEDDPDMQAQEWERMSQLCTPVIRMFGPQECKSLLDILSALSSYKRCNDELR